MRPDQFKKRHRTPQANDRTRRQIAVEAARRMLRSASEVDEAIGTPASLDWLAEATDIEEGDRVRDGSMVLSSYTGSLPGEVVDASIPSADEAADFPVTFQIDEDGRLRSVDISGPFYGSKGTVDYTVSLDDYGTDKDITKP